MLAHSIMLSTLRKHAYEKALLAKAPALSRNLLDISSTKYICTLARALICRVTLLREHAEYVRDDDFLHILYARHCFPSIERYRTFTNTE